MEGWIKIPHAFLQWDWFREAETLQFYLYCYLRANYKPSSWQGKELKRGQFITSLQHISNDTNLSIRKIRTAIKRLKSTYDLTCETTNKFTVITVCKYDISQGSETRRRQTERHTKGNMNDTQATTDKKRKNKKKEESSAFVPPSLEEVENFFIQKGYDRELAQRAYHGYSVADWKDSAGKQIINWKQKMIHVWFRSENTIKKTNNEKGIFY